MNESYLLIYYTNNLKYLRFIVIKLDWSTLLGKERQITGGKCMPVTPVFNVTDPYEGFTQTFTSKRGFESLLCIVVDVCSRCSWVKPFS